MFRLIKNLFSGIFSFIGSILGFGKKTEKLAAAPATEPKVDAKPKAEKPQPQKAAEKAFFLEMDDARGFKSPNGTAESTKSAPVATTANALNLPAPQVVNSTSSAATNSKPYAQFARRRPGSNMSSFLEMAKQVKTSS